MNRGPNRHLGGPETQPAGFVAGGENPLPELFYPSGRVVAGRGPLKSSSGPCKSNGSGAMRRTSRLMAPTVGLAATGAGIRAGTTAQIA